MTSTYAVDLDGRWLMADLAKHIRVPAFSQSINLLKAKRPNGRLDRSKIYDVYYRYLDQMSFSLVLNASTYQNAHTSNRFLMLDHQSGR